MTALVTTENLVSIVVAVFELYFDRQMEKTYLIK